MSIVGAFPGINASRRRTIRSPENPMDKSTIVSIYPKKIDEKKHTIQPGRFIIEPGTYDNPSILVVGTSSWWREVDEESPLLEIPNTSVQVADSVVRDYCNGLIACNMSDAMPGLFWLPGNVSVAELKMLHKHELDRAKEFQNNWYRALVRMTDTLWARTNGNPLCIGDDARLAARELGLNNKDWMRDFQIFEQTRCPACGSFGNPEFPVCQTCKAIRDPKKAEELGIQFAK